MRYLMSGSRDDGLSNTMRSLATRLDTSCMLSLDAVPRSGRNQKASFPKSTTRRPMRWSRTNFPSRSTGTRFPSSDVSHSLLYMSPYSTEPIAILLFLLLRAISFLAREKNGPSTDPDRMLYL